MKSFLQEAEPLHDLLDSYRKTRRGLQALRKNATSGADRERIADMINECTWAIERIKSSADRSKNKIADGTRKQSVVGYSVVIDSYKDLLTEIEQLEYLQNDLERQLQHANQVVWSGKLPSQPHPAYIGLDKAMSRYASLTERMEAVMKELAEKRALRSQLDEKFRQLEGINYIVAFKRRIEGKSLKVIAIETGYTEGWIKQVSMRVNRAITNHERTHGEAK